MVIVPTAVYLNILITFSVHIAIGIGDLKTYYIYQFYL